jgi:hypothetical protein
MRSLFLFVIAMISSAFTIEPIEYHWSKDYKVQLKDFQLDMNMPSNKLATIYTGVGMQRVPLKAYAIANREGSKISWRAYNGYRLTEVLEHEQLHFDIAEYIARRLNTELSKDPNNNENLFKQYMDTLTLIQTMYDDQTNHSNDIIWQDKWRKNIDSLLNGKKNLTQWKMYPY